MPTRWPVWKLAILLYVFAAGAVAINLFMLGLLSQAFGLTLQLHVSSKVCLPCCGLMSPSPHRPSDNISRFNLTLGQPIGDASDLLN